MREHKSILDVSADIDGIIVCTCGQQLRHKRNKKGANYAKKFKKLSRMHDIILEYAKNSTWKEKSFVKKQFRQFFINYYLQTRGKEYSDDAFNGRFSELLGMGFIDIVDQEQKASPLKTTKSPEYSFNWQYYEAFQNRLGVYA